MHEVLRDDGLRIGKSVVGSFLAVLNGRRTCGPRRAAVDLLDCVRLSVDSDEASEEGEGDGESLRGGKHDCVFWKWW